MAKKRLCVIGAGIAGLSAIRHGIANDCEVTAFDQNDQIGGLWIYDDNPGKNKYGLDCHSSLYKNLRTNLPKEVMGYPDFPFPEQERSFIPAKDVLKFLNLYADHFNLRTFIKFEHLVVRVRPIDDTWEVIVRNLPSDTFETHTFDLVLVCNGHYNTPNIPKMKNAKEFKGRFIHSHDYKVPEPYRNKRVLVIGIGPSGTDIAHEISSIADHVFISHRAAEAPSSRFSDNVSFKPEVTEYTANGAIFQDGSNEEFTEIVYCTGYKFTFPFLSVDCELMSEGNYVRPLFKHCLSVNKPTMGIIGLPFTILPSMMVDLQIRFCLKFMTGAKQMPSKDEMLRDTDKEMTDRWNRGLPKSKAHFMGPAQEKYYKDLAEIADIEPIKPVITKLYKETRLNIDVKHLRENVYRIEDDENFIKIK